MPADLPARFRALALGLCLLLGACATPSKPGPPETAAQAAADDARRDERQRIMEQYWRDQTAQAEESSLHPPAAPLLHYPAGVYDGLAFAPRAAADPSLAEPAR